MSDNNGHTTVGAKQLAMSRVLGAAFLSHQVEQLEKTVRGAGNWRQGGKTMVSQSQPQSRRGGGGGGGGGVGGVGGGGVATSAARSAPAAKGRTSPTTTRRKQSDEQDQRCDKEGGKGGADVVVVDASVLVHALYQVKRWCQQGRQEVLIVPLEALNTLDLLKKGTSSLAQRARAASRILEAQVGTNPRIRVQSDDAFVYWDKIDFHGTLNAAAAPPLPSPEWVRRTICCAKWEANNAHITLGSTTNTTKPRVVFAVLSSTTTTSPHSSPQSNPMGLDSVSSPSTTDTTPVVPLPAPTALANKFEPRSSGTLVSHWAIQAGVEVLPVEASVPGHGRVGLGDDEETGGSHGGSRAVKGTSGGGGGGGSNSGGGGGGSSGGVVGGGGGGYGYGGHGGGRRKPSVGSGGVAVNGHTGSIGLVERPPAVKAMMEMVSSQPSGKVVRVLARGEKLDP